MSIYPRKQSRNSMSEKYRRSRKIQQRMRALKTKKYSRQRVCELYKPRNTADNLRTLSFHPNLFLLSLIPFYSIASPSAGCLSQKSSVSLKIITPIYPKISPIFQSNSLIMTSTSPTTLTTSSALSHISTTFLYFLMAKSFKNMKKGLIISQQMRRPYFILAKPYLCQP